MEQRLNIITLGVSDLIKATDFYESIFGWKKSPTSNDNITFFLLNGIYLSLYEEEKLAEDAGVDATGEGFKKFTIAFPTRSEAEVDQIFADFQSKGVNIIKPPEKAFWGGYSGYVADLDGNLWEIAYNPYLNLDDHGNIVESD